MFNAFLKILSREFRYILRDSTVRNIALLAPILYALLMSFVYIRHSLYDLPVAVVQLDDSQAARTFARMVEDSPKLHIAYRPQSVTEVRELMLRGEIDAAVVIPENFAERLKRGRDSAVTAYINAASMIPANMATSAFNAVVQTFSAGVEIKTLMKQGASSNAAYEKFQPVKLDLRSMFNPSYNYTNFMIPGLLITVLQQVILLAMAMSWSGERERNTLGEVFAISKNPLVLICGKALPYFVINFLVTEFFFRVLFPLNDIPIEGSWSIMLGFSILFVATVLFWGMWFSAFCKTRLQTTQILMFLALPSFILSGYTWPLKAMPGVIQFFSHLLPITYFVSSFRNIYLAGTPFTYVSRDFLFLLAFLVVNIVLSWVGVKMLIKKHAPSVE